jgi:methionyl-tRNA synthetase
MKPTYYITTPIYYPSNTLHIGNAYTTIACDAMARYKRLRGFDVFYLTGTDEHGQKLQRRAAEEGKEPLAFIDPVVGWIQDLWAKLDISYDDFIRTTEPRHTEVVRKIFQKLYDKGDIYLGEYEGYYCVPCEAFWTERQAKEKGDMICPDCERPVSLVKEKSYFFRMSKYQDRLMQYIEAHPEFIQPESRRNEMVNNFLKPGLEDLCVSRTTFDWGIKVPNDPEHVIYVWIDALSNYITAIGYMSDGDAERAKFEKYWPADVHMIGKDILRFHTIYWPIILMALDLPLPKRVFGHGWLLMPDGKMSKSKGNVIDPKFLIKRYSSDAIRYFLLREIPFGQDGVFTPEAFIQRLNHDLANDLGNLVSRTLAMVEQNFGGLLPAPEQPEAVDDALKEMAVTTVRKVESEMEKLQFSSALNHLWQLVARTNKYIDETMPWALAKDEQKKPRLATVLYNLTESIRIISILIQPFLTKTPAKIWEQLGIANEANILQWEHAEQWGLLKPGTKVSRKEALFPRLDVAEEIKVIDETTSQALKQAAENRARKNQDKEEQAEGLAQIDVNDFFKVELRVAEVIEAEKMKNADKLLKLQLDLGDERRQVVSGIAKYYTPEKLVGQKVIVVANLKPVKLRGEESNGMILAASSGDQLVLATVSGDIPNGTRIK